ncbi:dihydroorotate dehydrogenase-like protein [Balneola sp. MJW-20]|uniref:dihydroorotate dehydrogenase-like protein n=1 Tax=Gracilimonas aurantiaca TaxID=3234185 RepID=UPI003464F06C
MNLSTQYLGLKLKNPLVPSASPLSKNTDTIEMMAEAGAGAIVMHSLFEEQLTASSMEIDHYLEKGTESFSEALSYIPEWENYDVGPDRYLENIRKATELVTVPIIGSLNGVSNSGWIKFAKMIEQAGADALELNIYHIPTDPEVSGKDIEKMYLDVIKEVCKTINIPVAVKFGPFFSSIPYMAKRMTEAGARGLVMFNRFYQPDIDIDELEVIPNLILSNSTELRLPLRWTAILYSHVDADIAITSGIHNGNDVIKGILAGASVTMMASELLRNGIHRLKIIYEQLEAWMEENDYESVDQMKGSMSQKNVREPEAFERSNYVKVLQSFKPDPTGRLMW